VDDVAIAFVGTLDNARDLAHDLERRGTPAMTATLPALLSACFRAYGENMPARLRGVFAGAVTDGESVYCFRDHIGYGPLFYRSDGNGFYAATEAKQVVAGAGIPKEPDLEVVDRIFLHNLDDETPCALRGVRRLPKSTGLLASRDDVRLRRYWQPEALLETARLSSDEIQDRFDQLMNQAVARCITGRDVVSLSGGIDSPAIAAFAAPRHLELAGRPLHALTVVYPKYPSVDERRFVEPLAEYLHIPLHVYEQETNALDDLDRWVRLTDTPFQAASLAHYAEDYRRARDLGFRTVLTGENAEFVFALQWFLLDHYLTHGRFRAVRRSMARRAKGRSCARWRGWSLVSAPMPCGGQKPIGRRKLSTIPTWVDRRKVAEAGSVPSGNVAEVAAGGLSTGVCRSKRKRSAGGVRRPMQAMDGYRPLEFFSAFLRAEVLGSSPKGPWSGPARGRVPRDPRPTGQDVFDESALAQVDYSTLRRYLLAPSYRITGVNYEQLAERLDAQNLGTVDYGWARNLANVHAFLAQW
jgi:hypothetical protein